jgi:hypothetical protein
MKHMKKMLNTGIVDQNQHHVPVSKLLIQAKACSIYEYLSKGVEKLNHLVQVQVG